MIQLLYKNNFDFGIELKTKKNIKFYIVYFLKE